MAAPRRVICHCPANKVTGTKARTIVRKINVKKPPPAKIPKGVKATKVSPAKGTKVKPKMSARVAAAHKAQAKATASPCKCTPV